MNCLVDIEQIKLEELTDGGWQATYRFGDMMFSGVGHTKHEAIGRLIVSVLET